MNAEKEMEVLRGEPVQVKIGEKEETVLRLSIDDQISVMDIIMESASEVNNKFVIERMIKIVSICVKRQLVKEDFSSAAQIVSAYNRVWFQNEFDFLLNEVGKLKNKAN